MLAAWSEVIELGQAVWGPDRGGESESFLSAVGPLGARCGDIAPDCPPLHPAWGHRPVPRQLHSRQNVLLTQSWTEDTRASYGDS